MDRTKIASRLKPPTVRSATCIPSISSSVLKEITTNGSSSCNTARKPLGNVPASSKSTVPAVQPAIRKGRRSKSFGISTMKASYQVVTKMKATNTRTVVRRSISTKTSSSNATAASRVNKGVTRPGTTTQPVKTAVKRPAAAEVAKPAVSAPKLSKFDYKGRFGVLEEKHKAMLKDFREAKEKLEIFEKENENYKRACEEQEEQIEELKEYKVSTGDVINQLKQTEQNLKDVQCREQQLQRQLKTINEQHAQLKEEHDKVHYNLQTVTDQKASLAEEHADLQNEHKLLNGKFRQTKNEISALKVDFASLQEKCQKAECENEQLTRDLSEARSTIDELKKDLREHEALRRKLHNDIQDLKGNIRVFCRVRPVKADEEDRMPCDLEYVDEETLQLKKSRESVMGRDRGEAKQEFRFDKVFSGESTQEEVFEDLSQLVQSTLDGYNVCVFAYGQTGSGKTFTMLGSGDSLGMIPRSVDLLFNKIAELTKLGWDFDVTVNFIEIYNETIKDLLNPDSQKPHDIMHNEGKGSVVTNLCTEAVASAAMVKKLMHKANNNRAIAATNFNLHSSRSHAVTKISVRASYEAMELNGSLNLVDLAGSESAKNSERMTETKNINKSLSALGNVMLALHNRDKHVPYRNSKLTYLLQSSLGGNSKTLMFVNISPLDECYTESVNSLRFASKVKEVKTGSKRNRNVNK